jgi:hypothetical protein
MDEEEGYFLFLDRIHEGRADFCSENGLPRVAVAVILIGIIFCFPLSFGLRYFASCPASAQWPPDSHHRLCFAFSNCVQGLSLLLAAPLGWALFSARRANFSRYHRRSLTLCLSVCVVLILSYLIVGSTTDLWVARKVLLTSFLISVFGAVIWLPRVLFNHIRCRNPVYYACFLNLVYNILLSTFNIWGLISPYEGALYVVNLLVFLFALLGDTGQDRFLDIGYMCVTVSLNMAAPPVCCMLYSAALAASKNEVVVVLLWVVVIRSFVGLVSTSSIFSLLPFLLFTFSHCMPACNCSPVKRGGGPLFVQYRLLFPGPLYHPAVRSSLHSYRHLAGTCPCCPSAFELRV